MEVVQFLGMSIKRGKRAGVPAGRSRTSGAAGVSIYSVAHQAGVSIVTVSRVFNDYPHVSPAMRERVLTAARQVGYQPRLVSKRNLLAVLVGGLEYLVAGDHSSRLMLALVRAAAAREYLIEFMPVSAAERATKHLVNGLIAVGLSGKELAALEDLPPVPKVSINNRDVDVRWSVAYVDPVAEVKLAVDHLAERGHRRIALVHDTSQGWYSDQREKSFFAAVQACGMEGHHLLYSAQRPMPKELTRKVGNTGCTASICLCSQGGLPFMGGLQNELNLRIPEDMSLITAEDDRICPYLKPRLTTMAQPMDQLAVAAVDGLIQQEAAAKPQRFITVLNSRLIKRDSVRCLN